MVPKEMYDDERACHRLTMRELRAARNEIASLLHSNKVQDAELRRKDEQIHELQMQIPVHFEDTP